MRGWIMDDFAKFSPELRDAVTLTCDPWSWTFYRVSRMHILYKTWAKSKFTALSPSNFEKKDANLRTIHSGS